MANSIKNKYEYLDEASIDGKLICTICNKPFEDPRCFSCGHIFCRGCITQYIEENNASRPTCQQSTSIDGFSEVDDLMCKKLDGLPVKCLECGQTILPRRNIHHRIDKACSAVYTRSLSTDITCLRNVQQDPLRQSSAILLFEPLKSILSELIIQNRDGKERMNQLEKHTQQQYQTLIEQLKNTNDLCVKQMSEQSKKYEELQLEIVQLREQIIENKTHISKLEADNQTQKTTILQIDEHRNILEIAVKSLKNQMKYKSNAKWRRTGITIAGEDGKGDRLNQLSHPAGIHVDDGQTIYIADRDNHRIVERKYDSKNGQVVAGGNGKGNRTDQLNWPSDVIVDKQNNSLIICDLGNRRVVRCSRQNGTSGETIISDIDCYSLTMDNNRNLYVSDYKKHEVRHWIVEESAGTIVAGGNGKGDHLNQLAFPTCIFVDEDYSVYVSDNNNHRVMKWMKDAKVGIVVAGGKGQGNSLAQLSHPEGVIVDQLGHVYVADFGNDCVMRWCEGAKEGNIVVGGNGKGEELNQFNCPTDISFDGQGNLYVADFRNGGVQKFEID